MLPIKQRLSIFSEIGAPKIPESALPSDSGKQFTLPTFSYIERIYEDLSTFVTEMHELAKKITDFIQEIKIENRCTPSLESKSKALLKLRPIQSLDPSSQTALTQYIKDKNILKLHQCLQTIASSVLTTLEKRDINFIKAATYLLLAKEIGIQDLEPYIKQFQFPLEGVGISHHLSPIEIWEVLPEKYEKNTFMGPKNSQATHKDISSTKTFFFLKALESAYTQGMLYQTEIIETIKKAIKETLLDGSNDNEEILTILKNDDIKNLSNILTRLKQPCSIYNLVKA